MLLSAVTIVKVGVQPLSTKLDDDLSKSNLFIGRWKARCSLLASEDFQFQVS